MRKLDEKFSADPKQRSKLTKAIAATHGRDDLFEELRKLRKELASEHNVPPYLIFGDKSLHDMCHLLPRNHDDFLMVNGVGQSKCEKYGDVFINTIRPHLNK
jgi:ATP-dependent DNA helicase RecQ